MKTLMCVLIAMGHVLTSVGFLTTQVSAREVQRDLPTFDVLMRAVSKSTSSAEFLDIVRRCNLRYYSRVVDLVASPRLESGAVLPNSYKVTEFYGGSGLLIVASKRGRIEGDLSSRIEERETRVSTVQFIVGDCNERVEFGLWKGELPLAQMPADPLSLLARVPRSPDLDEVEIKGKGDRDKSIANGIRKRTIVYRTYLPFLYSFTFYNDQLAIVEPLPLPYGGGMPKREPRED